MRITRAYTITPDVKRILDRKPNKSDFVCKAVRRYDHLIDSVSPAEFETRQLLAALSSRDDVSAHLKAVIMAELLDKS